jgi:hypothetical protein
MHIVGILLEKNVPLAVLQGGFTQREALQYPIAFDPIVDTS